VAVTNVAAAPSAIQNVAMVGAVAGVARQPTKKKTAATASEVVAAARPLAKTRPRQRTSQPPMSHARVAIATNAPMPTQMETPITAVVVAAGVVAVVAANRPRKKR
jgi:hypothetical protein